MLLKGLISLTLAGITTFLLYRFSRDDLKLSLLFFFAMAFCTHWRYGLIALVIMGLFAFAYFLWVRRLNEPKLQVNNKLSRRITFVLTVLLFVDQ
ncbi:hypothetical protein [Spirochaeta cellobiosiphila]|uniref:hypothetical protein n=1 Tax=Spirochaeta cellobiosiphila TaxID=504483 RepID=UPI00041B688D|nr:hypothetical protein [Spirochaeta cellobiosiphila]